MPLMKYFGFVGSALVLLLIAIGWCLPQQAMGPGNSDLERPVIRISSSERAPERVVIDTSLPTIVAPTNINPSISMTSVQFARPLQSAFSELDVAPKSDTPKSGVEVLKPKHAAKGEAAKKVSSRRAAKPLNINPVPAMGTQVAAPDTRLSLLETLKERLGHTFFKLN
ncbi:hypothetical protein IVB33_25380 [Bradyrhizobium sp. 24]|uniref:hypothetical protein n=1 Tax=unclassified Bradyrhizobium TaxID=2631580 RepID=UPI001FF92F22|nr:MULTISPECIES: hypothetical protein [unclassified Bradyrhizobium]MCK1302743.1 hypothetical protein [Bradyrhizobium sp. 37]MCK1380497.1 hypothetical protein [Bradyrhizobium sp. 24]MCK1770902.1 hypothetical protein [Bradyrhizobium sp. 134]